MKESENSWKDTLICQGCAVVVFSFLLRFIILIIQIICVRKITYLVHALSFSPLLLCMLMIALYYLLLDIIYLCNVKLWHEVHYSDKYHLLPDVMSLMGKFTYEESEE